MNLQAQTSSGLKWTSLSTVITSICQLAILVILARFLSPEDFGLMAIMMVVIGFSQAFMDMGVSKAIIHRQDVTHSQLSSLYWLNIIAGSVLSLVVFFIAPVIAQFFDHEDLSDPLKILSCVFVIIAVGNQYRILCQKNMKFKFMAIAEVSAAMTSLITAVALAIGGYGVYALVLSMLSQATVSSLIFLIIGLKTQHVPSLSYKHKELKGYFSFGLYQMGERSLNYINANIDNLLIGKILGMHILGFYNLAWQLCIFPVQRINPIVNKVAFPIYAQTQNDGIELQKHYQSFVATIAIITIPLLTFLFYFAYEVVRIVYGDGWELSAELIVILSLVGIIRTVGNPAGSLFLALGRADIGFWWNVVWIVAVFITLLSALLYFDNILYVAWSLLSLTFCFTIVWHMIVKNIAQVAYRGIILHLARTTFVSFSIGGMAYAIVSILHTGNDILSVAIAGVTCLTLYLPYLFLFEKDLLKSFIQHKE